MTANATANFQLNSLEGKITAYEYPDFSRANGYIVTVDPAEDDDVVKTRDTSNLSTSIIAKPYGGEPAKLVLEYVDRPRKLVEYYQVLAWILQWWGLQAHIELNKGGWSIWFQENYPELLALLPASYNSAKGGVKMSHGYRITPERWVQMKALGDSYVASYWAHIPSIRLIDELKVVGAAGKDDDLAMCFLAGLMILQGDRTPAKNLNQSTGSAPAYGYEKQGGVIKLVSPSIKAPSVIETEVFGHTVAQKPKKSALFKGL
jgi:hypothetical protein